LGVPVSFKSQAAFRRWLEKNHASVAELDLRLWKVHAAHRGLTYQQALDESLCFGWIDGVRRAYDDDSFRQRFTPRRPTSTWSEVNIRRFGELDAKGLVTAPGRSAFARRDDARSRIYSFEQKRPVELPPAMVKTMRANPKAWAFWGACPPHYRRLMAHWITSAKQTETRARRLAKLIDHNARRVYVPPFRTPARSGARAGRRAAAARRAPRARS
jgi:uncharacterized protein YdeI (YjbR/CyaY-like superfamily)